MYMKICSRCKHNSYSSFEFGSWECPSCKYDITEQNKFMANRNFEREKLKLGKKIITLTLRKSEFNRVV